MLMHVHVNAYGLLFATSFISQCLNVKKKKKNQLLLVQLLVVRHEIPALTHTSSPNLMACEPNVLVQWSSRNVKETDIEQSALMKIPLSQIISIFHLTGKG